MDNSIRHPLGFTAVSSCVWGCADDELVAYLLHLIVSAVGAPRQEAPLAENDVFAGSAPKQVEAFALG